MSPLKVNKLIKEKKSIIRINQNLMYLAFILDITILLCIKSEKSVFFTWQFFRNDSYNLKGIKLPVYGL